MDEYTMTWSDAVRTEADFLRMRAGAAPADQAASYGTLGTALWRERCLARVLALQDRTRASSLCPQEAHALVADLSADARWLRLDPAEAAASVHRRRDLRR